jgi:hypothetical protein
VKKANGNIGEIFVPLTRSVNARQRFLSFDARRVIDFLAEEHMSHGGMENGRLKAPHFQLVTCGQRTQRAPRHRWAEAAGLIGVYRAGMRTTTLFKLTFAVERGANPAARRPNLTPPKIRNLPSPVQADDAKSACICAGAI